MCEINCNNFSEKFEIIERALKEAKFISFDSEFSALNPLGFSNNSLFDTGEERYGKLRKSLQHVVPLQFGITAFTQSDDVNSYVANTFVFYLCPRPFASLDRTFVYQTSSIEFLCSHKFQFERVYYKGISFLNRLDEDKIKELFENDSLTITDSSMRIQLEIIMQKKLQEIKQWFFSNDYGSTYQLDGVIDYIHSIDFKYFLHVTLRHHLTPELWTYIENNQFFLKKVPKEELNRLKGERDLQQETLQDLMGLTRVFRLLCDLQKPMVGHNCLTDLMITLNSFERPIPKSYTDFKRLVYQMFPFVYDTKVLYLELNNKLERKERINLSALPDLYEYFQFGKGRHFIKNSPFIDAKYNFETRQIHDAGWDSYTTGYIFIRVAHIFASKKNSNSKKSEFVFTELLDAISEHKNKLNVIRGSVSHIQIDGTDPKSKRPPWLIVESSKDKQLNVTEVIYHLSQFGQVAIKPLNSKWRRALLAVDNYYSARRILKATPHPDFRVHPYNPLKHSIFVRALLWGTVATSGILTVFLFHSALKK